MSGLLIGLCGAGCGVGLLLIASAWTSSSAPRRVPSTAFDVREALYVALAALVGLFLTLALTGWVAAGIAAGAGAGWMVLRLLRTGGRRVSKEQERIEALAVWCEQLRDLLSAEHGVMGTVQATVATCPAALRDEVSRLATRLGRQDPTVAVRQFAAELDDPSGDLVASVLLLSLSRSGRTAELLSELASTIRERAAMRLRVEADRSGQRSEARFVVGMGVAVIAAVIVLGRGSSFLDAYDTATGQLVLAVVAGLYGVGLVWLTRLTRFEKAARFLSVTEAPR